MNKIAVDYFLTTFWIRNVWIKKNSDDFTYEE